MMLKIVVVKQNSLSIFHLFNDTGFNEPLVNTQHDLKCNVNI